MDHCEALIGALVDCETRLNYYSTNHIPESLGLLLRTAALDVHTVIKELQISSITGNWAKPSVLRGKYLTIRTSGILPYWGPCLALNAIGCGQPMSTP